MVRSTSGLTESAHSFPFGWRISRFDPALRDDRGRYPSDDWTSVSDIGKSFHGHILEREEYEKVESIYVESFSAFAHEVNVKTLVAAYFELENTVSSKTELDLDAAEGLLRSMLREEVHGRLESATGDFRVDVGFDLYIYIESQTECLQAICRTRELGLYVEEGWMSPWS